MALFERRTLMKNNFIYLDSYTLQQDMRIRLPKSVLANMNVEKGKTKFDIFFDKENCLISPDSLQVDVSFDAYDYSEGQIHTLSLIDSHGLKKNFSAAEDGEKLSIVL